MAEQQVSKTSLGPPGRFGASLVFWMLVCLSLSTLTPAILLPEWRQYQALHRAEQLQQARVDALDEAVAREQRYLKAFRSDSAVVARFAQRDLRYKRLGEVTVPVATGSIRSMPPPRIATSPVTLELPAPLAQAAAWLPARDYDAIFCDPATRAMIIGMSIALLIVALVLFSRPRRDTGAEEQEPAA